MTVKNVRLLLNYNLDDVISALLHPLIFDFYHVQVFYGPPSQYFYVVYHIKTGKWFWK